MPEKRLLLVAAINPLSSANSILTFAPGIDRVGLFVGPDKPSRTSAERIRTWLQEGEMRSVVNDNMLGVQAPKGRTGKRLELEFHDIASMEELPHKGISFPRVTKSDVVDLRPGPTLHSVLLSIAAMDVVEVLRPRLCYTGSHHGKVRVIEPNPELVRNVPPGSMNLGTLLQLTHGKLPTAFRVPIPPRSDPWVKRGLQEGFESFVRLRKLNQEVESLPRGIRVHYDPLFTKEDGPGNDNWVNDVKIHGFKFEAMVSSMVSAWVSARGLRGDSTELWSNLLWATPNKLNEREVDIILRIDRKIALMSIKLRSLAESTKPSRMSLKKKKVYEEVSRFVGESELLRDIPRQMREVFVITNTDSPEDRIEQALVEGAHLCSPGNLWDTLDSVFGTSPEGEE